MNGGAEKPRLYEFRSRTEFACSCGLLRVHCKFPAFLSSALPQPPRAVSPH